MKLLCFLALICAVSAHFDHRCTPPQVFESQIQEYMSELNISIPLARLYYDGENRRTRVVETIINNGNKSHYDIIYFQRCKVAFFINQDTKECTRTKVDLPWKEMSIPENATYLGDAYVGSAGIPLGGLLVQSWYGTLPDHGGIQYLATFTRHGCMPISFSGTGEIIGPFVANYYDVILGIADPNVFRPPKECFEQGEVLPEDYVHILAPIPRRHLRVTKPMRKMARQAHPLYYKPVREQL